MLLPWIRFTALPTDSPNSCLKTHQRIHQWNTVRSIPNPNVFDTQQTIHNKLARIYILLSVGSLPMQYIDLHMAKILTMTTVVVATPILLMLNPDPNQEK
jgi:hypothetical protein